MKNTVIENDLEYIFQSLKENSYENSTILITGCAGFLGYYFLNYFLKYADQLNIKKVIGVDNFMLHKPSWINELTMQYKKILEVSAFDISKDSIYELKDSENANYILHMASIASPTFYRKYPLVTLDANVWGLRKLFEYYKNSNKLKGLLFFSSSEIYGDPSPENIPTCENYRGNVTSVGPRACYDESKRMGETLCYIFAKDYSLPVTIVRPFNNYGPGMRVGDKRLPADFASRVIKKEDMVIYSDGRPTRTFCYIADAIIGYIKSLRYQKFDYFNIGIDKPELSVSEYAELFTENSATIFNHTPKIVYYKNSDNYYLKDNPSRRCPDISKARKLLNFNPSILPKEGIRRYLTFLKENL